MRTDKDREEWKRAEERRGKKNRRKKEPFLLVFLLASGESSTAHERWQTVALDAQSSPAGSPLENKNDSTHVMTSPPAPSRTANDSPCVDLRREKKTELKHNPFWMAIGLEHSFNGVSKGQHAKKARVHCLVAVWILRDHREVLSCRSENLKTDLVSVLSRQGTRGATFAP